MDNVDVKLKAKEVKEKVTFVAGVVILLCLMGSVLLNIMGKKEAESVANIQDTTFIEYEADSLVAKKVKLLYEIYNEETYQKARNEFPCEADLYNRLFSAENYTKGNLYYKPPTVDIMQVQYVLNKDETNKRHKYMLDINIVNNDTDVEQYVTCLVTVENGNVYSLDVF